MTTSGSIRCQNDRAARTAIRCGSNLGFSLLVRAAFAAPHAQSVIEVSNERQRLCSG